MECIRIEKHYEVEIRTICDDNGRLSRIYREKGKLLPRLLLEGFYIEQMKAFRSLDKDLRNIISWVKILNTLHEKNDFKKNHFPGMHNDDAAISKALFFAILVLYGRCFTDAENRRFTFDKKHIPEEYRDFHTDIMHARHNFAAHKGNFEGEDCQIALVLSIKKQGLKPHFFSELQQPYIAYDFLDNEQENSLTNLCNALRDVVTKKYADICNKIVDGFVKGNSLSYLKQADGKTVNIDPYFKK